MALFLKVGALAVSLVIGATTGAGAAIFGADDRGPVPARLDAVAQKLGLLLNTRTMTVCSAFCVAENVVATAAHCLHPAQPSSATRLSDFVFARNFDRIREVIKINGAASGSAAQNILAGEFKMRVKPPIDAAHDWALVRLQRDACPTGGLPVKALSSAEMIEEAKAGRVFQISYHRDWTQWRAAYSKPCDMARDFEKAPWSTIAPDFLMPEQIALHTCDTGGASSGSPMLIETADGPQVIAINVGTYVQSKIATQRGQAVRRRSDTIANTAVNATAFAHLIAPMRTAKILVNRGQIRQLQELLRERKLFDGKVDGAYGPDLKAAIEGHERAIQRPVTGLATQDLLMLLVNGGPERSGTVAPSSSSKKPQAR